jgi:hypothetical protein
VNQHEAEKSIEVRHKYGPAVAFLRS